MSIKIKYNNKNKRNKNKNSIRPVSPHIQIYKWEWTMVYSILHRASALGVGKIMILIYLSILFLPNDISLLILIKNYTIAKIIYFLSVLCINYYIFATIKYIVWDLAEGLDLTTAKWLGHSSAIATIIFTIGIYSYGLFN
jgi:succinate dehydrogenase / fumarate reductase cytochrome b subunit